MDAAARKVIRIVQALGWLSNDLAYVIYTSGSTGSPKAS